jgi:hypothetical protein
VEEGADDSESWGKTTAQPWGLPMQKESPNGGVKRRIADGEEAQRLTSAWEKAARKRVEASAATTFYRWRRGRVRRQAHASTLASRTGGAHKPPVPGSLPRGSRSRFEIGVGRYLSSGHMFIGPTR